MATGARDRISALPEEILQHILSFLPLKSAAQTSVLSKRWKTLWTYTLVLDFGSDAQLPDSPEPYISVIKRCLNLHKSKNLQKFQIHFFPGRKYSSLLDDWIRFAAKKGVKELDLELYPDGSQEVEEEEEEDEAVYDDAGGLPSSLFQSQSLSTLKLRCCVLNPPVKGFTGLKYLRTLELVRVSIWDKGLSRLVSNCRLLETLCICACRRLTNLKVCGADLSLKNLLVLGCRRLSLVEIYAPNLELFEFDGNNLSKLDLKNVASLREVGLFLKKRGFRRFNSDFREFQADFRKFLADISHVEVLNVGSWFLPYIFFECFVYEHKPMVFQNLKELHFYGASLNRCTVLALVSFLSGSPSLTEVDINLKYDCVLHPSNDFDDYQSPLRYENEFRVDGEKYWAAKGEQRFVGLDYQLQCLEIFKLKGFTGHECEMMLLKFTLERAVVLKSLVIKTERECDIKVKKEILQRRIAEFPAASSRGRVEISEPSMGDFGMRHRKMLKHLRLP